MIPSLSVSCTLPRGTAWFDTGNYDNLADAGNYVRILESREGVKVACLEEISWIKGWISDKDLLKLANESKRANYADYLSQLLK